MAQNSTPKVQSAPKKKKIFFIDSEKLWSKKFRITGGFIYLGYALYYLNFKTFESPTVVNMAFPVVFGLAGIFFLLWGTGHISLYLFHHGDYIEIKNQPFRKPIVLQIKFIREIVFGEKSIQFHLTTSNKPVKISYSTITQPKTEQIQDYLRKLSEKKNIKLVDPVGISE